MTIHGLFIDPQEDFCNPSGALFVPGADADVRRLAALVDRFGGRFDALHVTLDTHHTRDIAHPAWWVDAAGKHPAPFTIVTGEDVAAGRWRAADPTAQTRSAAYVGALAKNGRYPLCIWPYHCRIGTPGHAVAAPLGEALTRWELAHGAVDWVFKGDNPWTEHYSALKADVPDPDDPRTALNRRLVDALAAADLVFIGGEAGSHCVAHTVRDLADALHDDLLVRKLVLLTDTVSPVPGFEALQERFVADLTARGMRTALCSEL